MKAITIILIPLIALYGAFTANSYAQKAKRHYDVTKKYKYFDLYSLKGIETCNGDSCVSVTTKRDTMYVSVSLPLPFSMKIVKKKKYAHVSFGEFMDKSPYNLCLSEAYPYHTDMFIINDTIFEYLQTFSDSDVTPSFRITTRDSQIGFIGSKDKIYIQNPDTAYKKMLQYKLQYQKNLLPSKGVYNEKIVRDNQKVKIGSYYDYEYSYPAIQIWGLFLVEDQYRTTDREMFLYP